VGGNALVVIGRALKPRGVLAEEYLSWVRDWT